ncbi:glutamate racemase [Salinicola rhizosphaerae]|nr:glutamate racemase [Salinicola rhizosphaerae]
MSDVLVFDSGVGGLSVRTDIARRLPGASLDYVCDNAALPYGTKPDRWLVARIVDVCMRACRLSAPRVLVVACNTASTLALEALRERLAVPVVGTVPAIKPAVAQSRTRSVGLLATSATVNRPYLDRLVAEFADGCRVTRVAADPLVRVAETFIADGQLDVRRIRAVLAPLWAVAELDTVVLGCTHFPLLKANFAALAPRPVAWIDSGEAIARRVETLLGDGLSADGPIAPRCWATRPDAPGLGHALARFGLPAPRGLVSAVDLPRVAQTPT